MHNKGNNANLKYKKNTYGEYETQDLRNARNKGTKNGTGFQRQKQGTNLGKSGI